MVALPESSVSSTVCSPFSLKLHLEASDHRCQTNQVLFYPNPISNASFADLNSDCFIGL